MKDHEKAKWINRITATAKNYGHTQQLREHIGRDVLALIAETDFAKYMESSQDIQGNEYEKSS